jgi:hypothetical protein
MLCIHSSLVLQPLFGPWPLFMDFLIHFLTYGKTYWTSAFYILYTQIFYIERFVKRVLNGSGGGGLQNKIRANKRKED